MSDSELKEKIKRLTYENKIILLEMLKGLEDKRPSESGSPGTND